MQMQQVKNTCWNEKTKK